MKSNRMEQLIRYTAPFPDLIEVYDVLQILVQKGVSVPASDAWKYMVGDFLYIKDYREMRQVVIKSKQGPFESFSGGQRVELRIG